MKMSVIRASIVACSLFIATTALAQGLPTAHSAAGSCRGKTAAVNACFDGNSEGWLWFNWSNNGACNAQTAPLVCGLEETICSNSTNRKRVFVDGNCSTSMNCSVRVVNYSNGALVGTPKTITAGPGNFVNKYATVNCSDLAGSNYLTVQCDVPVGCKIWGLTTQETTLP